MGRLIGAHAALTRELSARLVEQHGLTLSEFEVLFLLLREPDRKLRRTDLAQEVRLSPSGVTRMLDRLEASGLVEKGACSSDARVTYAVLTDSGQAKLEECSPDHFAAVERLLAAQFDEEELATLAELLGRVSTPEDDASCEDAAGVSPETAAAAGTA
jgi:DNA-binding MarR family transcriptional regulator